MFVTKNKAFSVVNSFLASGSTSEKVKLTTDEYSKDNLDNDFDFVYELFKAYKISQGQMYSLIRLCVIGSKNFPKHTIIDTIKKCINKNLTSYLEILSPMEYTEVGFKKFMDAINYSVILLEKGLYDEVNSFSCLDNLLENLIKIKSEKIDKIKFEKKIEELVLDFKGPNINVQFPMSDENIDKIKCQFLKVVEYQNSIKNISFTVLQEKINKIKVNLDHNNNIIAENEKSNTVLYLVALICKGLDYFYKLEPNQTQIFSVLALMLPLEKSSKGNLAQIKAGEGKSIIITIFALIMACQNYCFDIVTSTTYLAKRDCLKFKPFFALFGVSTCFLEDNSNSLKQFSGQIVYSTSYNLEFAELHDILYFHENEKYQRFHFSNPALRRPYDWVMIDESDNMIIDKCGNSARIAYQSRDELILQILGKLYEIVKSSKSCNKAVLDECLKRFSAHGIANDKMEKYVENAYMACFQLELNKDYCLVKNFEEKASKNSGLYSIVSIDKETGKLSYGTRWSNGLHQFLEYKHGIPMQMDSLTIGALSHPVFFNNYKFISGLTGTIGTEIEREEIAKIYQLHTFDVPSHYSSKRIRLPTKIFNDNSLFNSALIENLNLLMSAGRPALIICRDIKNSKEINLLIKENIASFEKKPIVQFLNDTQLHHEAFVVERAGMPNCITISTNAGGRGVDIPLHQDVKFKGGLQVIILFFPHNERIELQAGARAARFDLPGDYQIFVPPNDDMLEKYIESKSYKIISNLEKNFFEDSENEFTFRNFHVLHEALKVLDKSAITEENLIAFRTEMNIAQSKRRIKQAFLAHFTHNLFMKFKSIFDKLAEKHKNADTLHKWALLFTNLEEKISRIKIEDSVHNKDELASLKEFKTSCEKQIEEAFNSFC